MSKSFRMTPGMIEKALSKFVLYWNEPHPIYQKKRFVTWSIDKDKDIKVNNPWPAIQRFVRDLSNNEAGNYNTINVYRKTDDKLILRVDKKGQWHYF